jgi:hypothetical protein
MLGPSGPPAHRLGSSQSVTNLVATQSFEQCWLLVGVDSRPGLLLTCLVQRGALLSHLLQCVWRQFRQDVGICIAVALSFEMQHFRCCKVIQEQCVVSAPAHLICS